jgi:hypothetical protein
MTISVPWPKVAREASVLRDFSLDATSPCARERTFFCARPRTTDVGAREMPRTVVTAGQVCKEGKFAEKMRLLAERDSSEAVRQLTLPKK